MFPTAPRIGRNGFAGEPLHHGVILRPILSEGCHNSLSIVAVPSLKIRLSRLQGVRHLGIPLL